jgi:predicted AAA+ superfamily ATPase
MAYARRIIDGVLDEVLPDLAAIALEGAKGVGKTATASQRAHSVLSLNDPRQREAVAANPDLVTQLPSPVLIDEWQLEPHIWDRVRRAVDDNATGGQFLLAGSAGVAPGIRIHSGAGRIVSLSLRPLAFSERDLVSPTVSLASLLEGHRGPVEGTSAVDVPAYTEEILRSGFPGIRQLPERARKMQLDSYLRRIVERELPESGVSVRRPSALRAWLAAYGAATATDAAYSVILDAATAGENHKPARQTVDIYREHLQRIFVLDPLPAWIPTMSPLKRLTHAPKHHLVDPALAARLVGVDLGGLLRGAGTRVSAATGTWLGALFESLVTQSVRVYAEAVGAQVGHLRTKNTEHEIDLVVEDDSRQLVAIEVKLSPTVEDKDVRHLNWLHEELGDRVADRVVVNTGQFAYRRLDGVAVVPLALLGP